MPIRHVRHRLAACLLAAAGLGAAGCSDSGPQVPILFVSSGPHSGAGTVTSAPAGINCSIANNAINGICSANFEEGTAVTLTASNAAGSTFTGWGEACSGPLPTCDITVSEDVDITADFEATGGRTLTVSGAGDATGQVTSDPAGINCSINGGVTAGTCSAGFGDGVLVTLTATATGASAFTTWTGACLVAGTAPNCVLPMTADRAAAAGFTASTTFSGFLAQTNSTNTSVFVVTIPTASPAIGGAGVRPASARLVQLPASGTITEFDGPTVVVAGTYDTETRQLDVGGGGWSLTGFVNGTDMDGFFGDPDGNNGVLSAVVSGSGDAPVIYCGDFVGEFAGTLQLAVSPDTVRGVVNSSQSFPLTVAGSVSGRQIFFADQNPDGSPVFDASGAISADDLTITGVWGAGATAGNTWTVSTPCD